MVKLSSVVANDSSSILVGAASVVVVVVVVVVLVVVLAVVVLIVVGDVAAVDAILFGTVDGAVWVDILIGFVTIEDDTVDGLVAGLRVGKRVVGSAIEKILC